MPSSSFIGSLSDLSFPSNRLFIETTSSFFTFNLLDISSTCSVFKSLVLFGDNWFFIFFKLKKSFFCAEVVSMNRRLLGKEKSLNDPIKDEGGTEWQDWIVDDKIDQELKLSHKQEFDQRKKLMDESISILNPREKEILTARRLSEDKVTLEKLSEKYNLSRERIRQIEAKAFEKLQKAMLNAVKSNNLLPKN